MGAFGFQAGLDKDEFSALIFQTIGDLLHAQGDAFVLIGKRKDGGGAAPLGVVTTSLAQAQVWPHVRWFPWASARNRVECALRFLMETKEKCNLVIPALPDDVDFFLHLCRYGVIRRIGTGRGWLGDSDVVLFETVRQNA